MSDKHVERCRFAMADGQWHTLPELVDEIGCSEAAASARVRDLRKTEYGNHKIVKKHVGPGGLHVYRLVRPLTLKGMK